MLLKKNKITRCLATVGTFPAGVAKKNVVCRSDSMLDYLLQAYERVDTETRDLKKASTLQGAFDLMEEAENKTG